MQSALPCSVPTAKALAKSVFTLYCTLCLCFNITYFYLKENEKKQAMQSQLVLSLQSGTLPDFQKRSPLVLWRRPLHELCATIFLKNKQKKKNQNQQRRSLWKSSRVRERTVGANCCFTIQVYNMLLFTTSRLNSGPQRYGRGSPKPGEFQTSCFEAPLARTGAVAHHLQTLGSHLLIAAERRVGGNVPLHSS